MSNTIQFRAWLADTIADAPHTPSGIPLIGYDNLDLKDASAAPLISALADIIETACCVQVSLVVPTTHANAA